LVWPGSSAAHSMIPMAIEDSRIGSIVMCKAPRGVLYSGSMGRFFLAALLLSLPLAAQ